MYEVLAEKVMIQVDDKWLSAKVVLATCIGGKRVDYVDENGNILKSEAYCRSKYSKESKDTNEAKVLEENVMLRMDGKWLNTTVILSNNCGGKHIDYVAEDGTVLKSKAYCRSKYGKDAKSKVKLA